MTVVTAVVIALVVWTPGLALTAYLIWPPHRRAD
jgi:hypothetical protein